MTYASLLSRIGQPVGYRLRICGVKYYWVSHSSVPTLTDSAGGTAYTRVEGAFYTIPNPLSMSAHPLQVPGVATTTVELIDIDNALTELWATERDSPMVLLDANAGASDTTFTVVPGPTSVGLAAFPAAGFAYCDRETVEYTAKGATTLGVNITDNLIRGKFAEGMVAGAGAAHTQYVLAQSQLARPVFGYVPNLWYRPAMLEIFDLDNTANTETIAMGFIIEPEWVGEEIFRLKIQSYAHELQRQVFRRSEIVGTVATDFKNKTIANPKIGATETLYVASNGTPEILPDDAFLDAAHIPTADDRWMPSKQMYVLVGSDDDGEIMGYTNWSWNGTTRAGAMTINMRGCFDTMIGDDEGQWPAGTSVRHLCVLAGYPTFQYYEPPASPRPSQTIVGGTVPTEGSRRQAILFPGAKGVNPVDAMLMLLMSTGAGANNRGGGDPDYDVLPYYYGLGVPYTLVDITAFENFKRDYCQNSNHVYIAKAPIDLLTLLHTDLAALYGGLLYVKPNGQITITRLKKSVPNDTITTILEKDMISVDTIGVRDVFNTIRIKLDQWPSGAESTVSAIDHRRRDSFGDNPAPEIVSDSLRGPGFRSPVTYTGDSDAINRVVEYLKVFGNGAPMIEMTVSIKHADLEVGDYIEFTHQGPPQIISNTRGFSSQLAIVLGVEVLDSEAQVKVKAMLLKRAKTCLWAPSAEIDARTDDENFTIKAAVFSADDRAVEYWDDDTNIMVWDANMTAITLCTIDSYNPATGAIVLVAPGSPDVQNNNRITWSSWDDCRVGGARQLLRALDAEWYGFFADANGHLGAGADPPRVYL